ncbi:FG-GAP repeat domain-containing protein [Roseimaritima ulvae]|uniref:FG-GAP repeat protein n=1 Tax=Roseimaritima ulvae TaxID=980254 RepID=A0A5B9R022_9BACT|nr:VCBS repeat-containing protein [Roseimaritima ulvae]QEG39601.1 FG-GAP repeat protein [Roseimaritima ulvae]
MRIAIAFVCLATSLTWAATGHAQSVSFEAQVIDAAPGKVVYAVTAADIDNDGRQDLVAVTEDSVHWYQAPRWRKRTLLSGVTIADNVCVAPFDIDRNGHIDLALGAGWPNRGGTIQWLSPGQTIDHPWNVHEIAAEAWTHRMRWGNVLSGEEPQLIVSPLHPSIRDGARLLAFSIPKDPRHNRWRPTVLDESLHRMHNHLCVARTDVGLPKTDTSADAAPQITLTASQEGVSAVLPDHKNPKHFRRVQLLPGATGDSPASQGAGEVRVGQFANGKRFVATVEPMHGTHAVVYEMGEFFAAEPPRRTVLTDQLRGGHALWCADLDGDHDDEVVVGYREPNPLVGILIFDRQADGAWQEQRLTAQVACEDLVVADFNGDGLPDILAGGRATHNVVLFVNQGVR